MSNLDLVLNFVAYAAGYAALLTLPISVTIRFVSERIQRRA
jgi:hypothetical protein